VGCPLCSKAVILPSLPGKIEIEAPRTGANVDSLDLDEAQFIALMRRFLDPVWNACGWASSHNFDAEGQWNH
jgi:hypothetical protein